MTGVPRLVVGVGVFAALTVLERRFRLRPVRHRANRRLVINLAVGVIAFGLVALAHGTIVLGVVAFAERHHLGLVRWLGLPPVIAAPVVVVFLDYTLWVWHWLNHRVPGLWR